MRKLLIVLIRAYQKLLSPFISPCCRFVPTCSEYMIESLEKNGLFLGLLKGMWRVVRCNPFFPGGYDPVE